MDHTTARRSPRPHLLLALLVAALVCLTAACGQGRTADVGPSGTAAAADGTTLVARPASATPVYDHPGDAEPAQLLPAATEFGSPLALTVVEEDGGWLHVQLPTRPNGSTGWIDGDGVELRTVSSAVHVDLSARTLRVTDHGETALEVPVAIGAPGTPTPTGTFFVTDLLATGDDGGAYGPFAIGLSAHSDVLTEFAGGDAQVGIHGTNQPDLVGSDVSNGCVRVTNEVALQLRDLISLGTPVTVA